MIRTRFFVNFLVDSAGLGFMTFDGFNTSIACFPNQVFPQPNKMVPGVPQTLYPYVLAFFGFAIRCALPPCLLSFLCTIEV